MSFHPDSFEHILNLSKSSSLAPLSSPEQYKQQFNICLPDRQKGPENPPQHRRLSHTNQARQLQPAGLWVLRSDPIGSHLVPLTTIPPDVVTQTNRSRNKVATMSQQRSRLCEYLRLGTSDTTAQPQGCGHMKHQRKQPGEAKVATHSETRQRER